MAWPKACAVAASAIAWLALGWLCGGSCRTQASSGYMRVPGGQPSASAELAWMQGELRLTYADGRSRIIACESPRPYRAICSAAPAVVTTIDEELYPCTYAGRETFSVYPGMLPSQWKPPVIALAPVGDAEGKGVALLGVDGSAAWSVDIGELLHAACSATEQFALVAVPGADADDLVAFGSNPELCLVDCASMQELWRVKLPMPWPVAGLELIGQAETGLAIAVQRGFETYTIIGLDLSGKAVFSSPLDGQPATRLVWPGPLNVYSHCACGEDWVEFDAFVDGGKLERWTIDLRRGSVTRAPSSADIHSLDERELGDDKVRQSLLPTASASSDWRIEAVVDQRGRVLVVSDLGAQWL